MEHLFVVVHPTEPARNVFVRIENDESVSLGGKRMDKIAVEELLRLQRSVDYGLPVVIRPATPDEARVLDDTEQDMEAHEADVGFWFPDQRNEVNAIAQAWSNPFTMTEIIGMAIDRCDSDCRNAGQLMRALEKENRERITNRRALTIFLETLNFPALRENKGELKFLVK